MEEIENKGELYYLDKVRSNIDDNILSVFDAHPETTFIIYLVPYSISFWYMEKQSGLLDANNYNVKTALGEILSRKNTEVHFFQDEEAIITNLDNYRDYTHFKPEINSWMSKEIHNKSHVVDAENFESVLNSFYDYLGDFDYDSYYQAM